MLLIDITNILGSKQYENNVPNLYLDNILLFFAQKRHKNKNGYFKKLKKVLYSGKIFSKKRNKKRTVKHRPFK